MAQQDYQDEGGDWFEQNAPPAEQQQDPRYDVPQLEPMPFPDDGVYQTSTSYAQAPTVDNGSGYPTTSNDDPNSGGGNGGGGDNSGGGGGGEDLAARAAGLARSLGISDLGNIQSLLSGRASWDEYERDTRARATNYTGNRLLDSQGGNYNNNGTLTAQGIAALARAGLNPNGTRITATGAPSGGGFTGDYRDYGMLSEGSGSFGATPAAFGETYSTLERPEYLRGEYKPPVWSEQFKAPSLEDVQNEPGYALGLKEGQNALERSAAARGSILSGGTQKATARYGTDYGATKYGEATGRLFDQYQQRYGQFLDAANLQSGARATNENAYQTDSGNNLSQYLTRFNAYQTALGNTRNAENDVWSRNQDLIRNSLTAAGLARPF